MSLENGCTECGKECEIGEYHDYVECVRYRWDQRPPSPERTDIRALLAVIDGTPRPGNR